MPAFGGPLLIEARTRGALPRPQRPQRARALAAVGTGAQTKFSDFGRQNQFVFNLSMNPR